MKKSYPSQQEQKELQERKLKLLIDRLYNKSTYYRNLFKQNLIDPQSIQTLEDLQKIPTTDKDQLQANNWDFLCVDKNEIVEYTSTSGSLGNPVIIALTEKDLKRLALNEYFSYQEMDANSSDIFQLALTLDKQFMAGMAYYQGCNMLGAAAIRTGPGNPSMQWDNIQNLGTQVIVVVPSFLLKLIDYAKKNGIDYRKSSLKKAICIGEGIRDAEFQWNTLGKRIHELWPELQVYSTYASTEMQTAFTECSQGNGGHLHYELLIAEVLDDYGKVLPFGQIGELVITTLDVEGMPLLRYRTGDLCYLTNKKCNCGRESLRISPIIGRKKQMIKFKGTTLFPPLIFDTLNQIPYIEDYLVILTDNDIYTDELEVAVSCKDSFHKKEAIAQIEVFLQSKLKVRPKVRLETLDWIQKRQKIGIGRKLSKLLDLRE
ncbi:MAG: phenylacetate--CoA ligase family protein [Bacteroidales bacterium]